MGKVNCWEFKECGREPGGARVHDLGVCPATTIEQAHGIHGGERAGRACWAVVGTLCKGEVQDSMAAKLRNCVGCDFRTLVEREEGAALVQPMRISDALLGRALP